MDTTLKAGHDEDIKQLLETMGAELDMDHGDFAYFFSDIFVASV